MEPVLGRLPQGARVLVIRLRSLGDCVLTTPALEILKQARPDLHLAVVVEDRFSTVFEGNPDIDAILAPRHAAVSAWRADLCLNLHGGTRSMILTAASAAHLRAGFAHHRSAGIYNLRIPTAQEILGVDRTVHTAEHLAAAIFWLGAPAREIPRAKLSGDPLPPRSPFAVIHPFASAPDKTWPPDRFLAVARHLRDTGIEPVFVAGPDDDLCPFQGFESVSSLPKLKSLLHDAALFLGNDSGPAHMAAAQGIPVVVLFGPSDPVIWAPWKTKSQVLVDPENISRIGLSQVLESVDALLAPAKAHR